MCCSQRLLRLCAVAWLWAAAASAQVVVKAPAYEIQAGYSNLSGAFPGIQQGGSVTFMANLNRRVGAVVEAAALFGDQDVFGVPPVPGANSLNNNTQTLLFGPRVRILRTNRFTVSAHSLFGWNRAKIESLAPVNPGEFPQPSPQFRTSALRDVDSGIAFGGTFDVRIRPAVSLVIQSDWMQLGGFQLTRNELRITTGISYRFGGL